jgi:uncharacterized repeat protein (TIGR01451 family)
VTLTATPEDGSSFEGWGGACTNTEGDCVLTISEARHVTASFTRSTGLIIAKSVTPVDDVTYQGVVTYTLAYSNTGLADPNVILTDALPDGVEFGDWINKPSGMDIQDEVIQWTGSMASNDHLSAIFTATHTGDYGDVITNTAEISGTVEKYSAQAAFTVKEQDLYIILLIYIFR